MIRLAVCIAVFFVQTSFVAAQSTESQSLHNILETPVSARMIQLFTLLSVLSIAPGILIMVTCFTRIVIVFSLLRTSLGLQSAPGNMVLISLALFMTYFVMAPTLEAAWNKGVQPLLNKEISEKRALELSIEPFRKFMLSHVRESDLKMFSSLASKVEVKEISKIETKVLIPAFMISELRRAFEIGFLIAIPFLIIDIVVATIVMAMGMMMLPPSVISLPIKVLFFVLIDGWNLIVGSLIRSFG